LPDNSNRWWDPDRKEYPVDLTLSQTPAGLKPGVTSRVEIVLDHMTNVLAAPLGTIYSEGDDRYVFIRHGNDVKPYLLTVGQTTETHGQLLSGVSAGDQLMILEAGQGRQLLEKAGIARAAEKKPSTQPATQPTALLPTTQPSTQPADVAGSATQPSTKPNAVQTALDNAPTTRPATAKPSTQPSSQPIARL